MSLQTSQATIRRSLTKKRYTLGVKFKIIEKNVFSFLRLNYFSVHRRNMDLPWQLESNILDDI